MNHLVYACFFSTSQTTRTNVSVLLRTVFIANVGKFPSASQVDASCLRCISFEIPRGFTSETTLTLGKGKWLLRNLFAPL